MSLAQFKEEFIETLLSFAWRQWGQMGVSAHVPKTDSWSVDPEALILFSIEIGRLEARIFDEILDWCICNSRLINIQRMRNLAKRDPHYPVVLLSSVVETVRRHSGNRAWKAIDPDRVAGAGTRPLFMSSEGLETLPGQKRDPVFDSYGFVRSPCIPSKKSAPPLAQTPFNLVFKLRGIFGISSRAEIIRYLMLRKGVEANAATIADAAGFAKRNINESLNDLAFAGVVRVRDQGNEKIYSLPMDAWLNLLGINNSDIPAWVAWPHLFRALSGIFSWLIKPETLSLSPYLQSSETRNLMREIRRDLAAANVNITDDSQFPGESYLSVFIADIKNIMADFI